MKVAVFAQNQYRTFPADFQDKHDGTVTTPWLLADPGEVRAAFRDYLDHIMHAARLGFDGVAFTEHAQTTYDMVANPSLVASAIAYATETEGLGVAVIPVGRTLGKTREPVRAAEEYAMIDCISGGRLIAGFPVGLMFDAAINNGVPPIEVRQRFEENLPLVLRAWREKEPFAWNGRFSQLPSVNVWPRPLQQPLPPIWVTGVGNPTTMRLALENNFAFNYFGWFGARLTARRVMDRFWDLAANLGSPANPCRLAFVQAVCVGETDAEAERKYSRHIEYFFNKGVGATQLEKIAIPGGISLPGIKFMLEDQGGDFGFSHEMRHAKIGRILDVGAAIAGSANTVADYLVEFARANRIGNYLVMLKLGSMPRDLVEENVTRFAEGVLPKLRAVWADQTWDHHWWPARLGGKPGDAGMELGGRAGGAV
jgi:alkanesulfonate monooxygenase SsuD/methylene tetrahydromethanopterin reductase-like flavin-dependent oxidoreductase (luciferase family)